MPLGLGMRPFSTVFFSSPESVGLELSRMLNQGLFVTASAVWPTTNLAIYLPFRLDVAARVRQLGVYNGAAVSGNIDIGIYRYDGTRVLSTGSTAQAGTSALQTVNVTDTDLPPGRYYLALGVDNTTATIRRISAITAAMLGSVGMLQEVTFPLPATMTPVTVTNAYLPVAYAQFGRMT